MNIRAHNFFFAIALYASLSMAAQTAEAPYCKKIFKAKDADYKALNHNAQKDLATYDNPNRRPLSEYDSIIGLNRRKIKSLIHLVPENGLILDLGGGIGIAMKELADQKNINAININAQAPNDQVPKDAAKGTFTYQQGWAEEVLPTYEGRADVVVDIWGAFSYSPLKVEILELVYAALKPGGKAYILFHPKKTPAEVEFWTPEPYSYKRSLPLHQYLAEHFPKIFKTWNSTNSKTYEAKIIEISKPDDGPDKIKLNLETIKVRTYIRPQNTFVGITIKAQENKK